ncbi:hypothetical protein VNO78_11634 [Psophocarpus tetragonolobus]|uniref:Uncharacterized protein n=1 Tax=Psophocarpus tetragonolobus TaxID=3891 RepID=A0AAN9SMU3_PSOTE
MRRTRYQKKEVYQKISRIAPFGKKDTIANCGQLVYIPAKPWASTSSDPNLEQNNLSPIHPEGNSARPSLSIRTPLNSPTFDKLCSLYQCEHTSLVLGLKPNRRSNPLIFALFCLH